MLCYRQSGRFYFTVIFIVSVTIYLNRDRLQPTATDHRLVTTRLPPTVHVNSDQRHKDMKRGPTSPLARFLANAKKHQGEGSSQEIPSEQMDMLQCLLDGQRAMQEDFQDLRVELKTSRTQITTIADKYEQLETNVSSIDTDFKDLLNELRDMKVKYESDHLIIKDLKRQLDYANSKIVSLETRLTSLSLEIRDRSLIINGIPEDDLTPLISQVHDILGKLFPSLHRTDIDLVYRTGARFGNTPRPVFVSFIRARDKREIFERRDTLRDDISTNGSTLTKMSHQN